MNGQRIVQVEDGDDWSVVKVAKANGLRPAIYNLSPADPPNKAELSQGQILHADRSHVWQETRKGHVVVHNTMDFDRVPEIGLAVNIKYDASSRAQVEAQLIQPRSRTR